MRKEDIIIEAYDLIKGEYASDYPEEDFVRGVLKMADICMEMMEDENR